MADVFAGEKVDTEPVVKIVSQSMPVSLTTIFFLVVAIAYLAAGAFYPTLAWTRRRRLPLTVLAITFIALTPLGLPATAKFHRLLAAVNATALMVKLYDLHMTCGPGLRPTFAAYVAYLPNFLSVVWRKLSATPQPSRIENARRLAIALLQAAAAITLFVWLMRRPWENVPFAIEHTVKVFTFFLALIPVTHAHTAFWRLCGGRGLDPMNRPLLAATPADFWRRYNRPAQQFFHDHIYRRVGGPPIRAILITFVLSAIIHEYVFSIALSRVQGCQTVFFLLQGIAAAATIRVRPTGLCKWAAIAATLSFNLASGVFFFVSVQGAVPFYANGLPTWLLW